MSQIKIQFITMESWDDRELVAPLGPNNKGVFTTEADAEQAILKYLERYAVSPCPLFVRKQFIKE